MKEQVKVLKQVELLGHQFAVYGTKENPLFLAKDIATLILGDKMGNGATARITRAASEFEKQKRVLRVGRTHIEYCFLTLAGAYEVANSWAHLYGDTTSSLNAYLLSNFGKVVASEHVTNVAKKESVTTDGDTVIKRKVVSQTIVGKKAKNIAVEDKTATNVHLSTVTIPAEAASIIKNIQDPQMSEKEYLFEAICSLIEVMYDTENTERTFEMKDLFPLWHMAQQRNLIKALQR